VIYILNSIEISIYYSLSTIINIFKFNDVPTDEPTNKPSDEPSDVPTDDNQ